uniref:Uncharacterized protein n=1 Tax=Populus alba TaxID=43335 RepID=A0A4U5Q3A9_POPAL|nr:hypothetical protein D5086_0000143050 [Populus alba]
MKIIQLIKVKFRKLRDNKFVEIEQRRMPDFFYEGHNQVLEERNSLKDQLSEANRKIADLENKARAFEVQGTQQFLNYQVSHGRKEKDDGKDEEIERLEGELGIKNLPCGSTIRR